MDTKKKILLVEDDTALAAVYRSRLELEGFDIREVNNGEDALTAAIEFKPDLILLDAMMPKISGFDVLDILRNTPDTTNIRVIMLTALSQPKDKERAESLGADDYLVKSQVVIGDVVERVKFHLGMTKQRQKLPVKSARNLADFFDQKNTLERVFLEEWCKYQLLGAVTLTCVRGTVLPVK